MAAFKASLESLGHTAVTTYIQSGNAVFDSTERKPDAIARQIEAALASDFGAAIDVVVRSARDLTSAIDANPFVGRVADVTKLHVLFLDRAPDAGRLRALDAARFAPDEFAAGSREVYLHLPNGVGRSKLAIALGPKLAPAVVTLRNWNTVTKLAELATR
jgi:uncharacterized protein (DUF1697 family)